MQSGGDRGSDSSSQSGGQDAGPESERAGRVVAGSLPKEIKDKAWAAFKDNDRLADVTAEERELAAQVYERAAEMTAGPVAGAARLYNLERARFLRGLVPRIAGSLREFMAERGIPFPAG